MNCDRWFPTCVWWNDLEIDNQKIKNYSLEMEKHYPNRVLTNSGGWQSKDLNLQDETLSELFDTVTDKVNEVRDQMRLQPEPLLANSWININRKGNYNKRHSHPCCFFSAVYYTKVPEDSESKIIFYDPRRERMFSEAQEYFWDELNDINFSSCGYTPREGMLLIFPSWLDHEVEPCKSEESRISIAFNYTLDF